MPQPIESLDRSTLERRYRRMRLAAAVLAVITALLVAVLLVQGLGGGAATAKGGEDESAAGSGAAGAAASCPIEDRREQGDPRALGDEDAPIVLHEWTDFRCPYCGAFSRDTLPILIEEYVDTGKVRLEVHDAALVGGENSILIAAAARAAGEQGRYFEFYDEVYAASEKSAEEHQELDVADLVNLAKTAGVPDIDAFSQAVEDGTFEDAVRAETAEAQTLGITGVPFFATTECGAVLSGAQPADTFRKSLDDALAAAKKK